MVLTHMLNIICTSHIVILWCTDITGAAQHSYHTSCSYRMVCSLSHGRAVMYGPCSLRTVKLNIEWFGEVLIYCDIYRMWQRIGYMEKSLYTAKFICCDNGLGIWWSPYMPRHFYAAKLMVTSNSYVTWHSPVASPYNVSWVGTCAWSWLQCFGDLERCDNITLEPWLGGMAWFSFSIWL